MISSRVGPCDQANAYPRIELPPRDAFQNIRRRLLMTIEGIFLFIGRLGISSYHFASFATKCCEVGVDTVSDGTGKHQVIKAEWLVQQSWDGSCSIIRKRASSDS